MHILLTKGDGSEAYIPSERLILEKLVPEDESNSNRRTDPETHYVQGSTSSEDNLDADISRPVRDTSWPVRDSAIDFMPATRIIIRDYVENPLNIKYRAKTDNGNTYPITESEYNRIKEILRVLNGEAIKEIEESVANEQVKKEISGKINGLLRMEVND